MCQQRNRHTTGQAYAEWVYRAVQPHIQGNILDAYLFENTMQIQILAEEWMQDYNYSRPHEALGGKTPMEYRALPAACFYIWIIDPTPVRKWGGLQIKEMPYANAAYQYDFKRHESGKLTLEFWITPFDYVSSEGPSRAVETVLVENNHIGLSWAVLDYDDETAKQYNGFWNLSKERTMYGNASFLLPFRLMPIEEKFLKSIDAYWSFSVIDMTQRLIRFKDESIGEVTSWNWDFGDGNKSLQQNPIHAYSQPGHYTVTLSISGPAGTSRMTKVWEVAVK